MGRGGRAEEETRQVTCKASSTPDRLQGVSCAPAAEDGHDVTPEVIVVGGEGVLGAPVTTGMGDIAGPPANTKLYAKVAYFTMYFAFAGSSPFFGLLYTNLGFSPSAVGALAACMPFFTLCLLTPLSYVADRYKCALKMLMVSAVMTIVTLVLMTLPAGTLPLGVVAIIIVVHYAFRTPTGPFLDYHTMSALPADRKTEWGALRSYGAYGWGIGAPVASALVGVTGWWICGVIFFVGMAAALLCYAAIKPSEERLPTSLNFLQVLRYVVDHRRLLAFLCAACCMGMGYSLIETFLFVFLDGLGAPPILLGLSIMLTVVVEIPLFQMSRLVHSLATDRQLLLVSMASWSIRVTGYSLLHNPWFVLFFEPLHGFTFGLMWLSGVHFTQNAFPKSLAASSMGFLSAFAFGIGPLMGNVCGGVLYHSLGPRWMFRVAAVAMLLMSGLFYIVDRYLERQGHHCDSFGEDSPGSPPAGDDEGTPGTAHGRGYLGAASGIAVDDSVDVAARSTPTEDARRYCMET